MVKTKVNDFLDLLGDFHAKDQTEQIVLLVYFHGIEEGRESVNKAELERLFDFSDVPQPKNLPQLLAYLCGKGGKLIQSNGEYRLRREIKKSIDESVQKARGETTPPKVDGIHAFDFPGQTFKDKKISALLDELRKCYATHCWNAAGLLIRIIIERTLDAVSAEVKAKSGLKDKINKAREAKISKSLKEGLDQLHGAKLAGDVAAHHSTIVLDRGDVDVTLNVFRTLLKEVPV